MKFRKTHELVPIKFSVDIMPVAQGRATPFLDAAGTMKKFDPKKSRVFKEHVRYIAEQHKPERPLIGPLKMILTIRRPIVKGVAKPREKAMLQHHVLPSSKPDLKNYIWAVEDALEGTIYYSDAQITDIRARKIYAKTAGVDIEIFPLRAEGVNEADQFMRRNVKFGEAEE